MKLSIGILIMNMINLLIVVITYLVNIKNPRAWLQDLDKKEHKLYRLYPIAELVLRKTGIEAKLNKKTNIVEGIKALHVTNKPELPFRLFWYKRVSLLIMIFVLFNLLSLLSGLKAFSSDVVYDGKFLKRPAYGNGSTFVDLKVIMEEEGQVTYEEPLSQEVTIKVEEQKYTKEQRLEEFEKAKQFLKIDVLGNNKSTEYITASLHFSEVIPGTSITVKWKPENYTLIRTDGSIDQKEVASEGVETTVTAILIYQKLQEEITMNFRIMPENFTSEERIMKKLEEKVEASAKENEEKPWLELPQTLESYHISWEGRDENTGLTFGFIGMITAIFIWIFQEKELEKQVKSRKEQMILDYPEIVNKFTLLINAGMTIKQAFNKITEDYTNNRVNRKEKKRYAYEEISVTVNELKLGVPEGTAFEQLGKRIGLISYIKFTSLIIQNLRKGNKGFTELLIREAEQAFEERKETAKRLGEEAGTRLLAPMMFMLVMVFLIILIPAFMSFQL